ncbi:unnamed protein product [Linum tenue]|uniref:alpha-mannosidase n=1 Tax=Linum tenue TaxID=586396 RepID=A0AAV0NCD6_9ROSI|nr:unnamed protein product [Linum tenue]
MKDDINLFDYNVPDRVNDFVAAAIWQANITRGNHVMFTMGTDFKYQYANSWFRQMDKLIHYVNMDGRVNVLYSTPSIYTDAKHSANEAWPLKTEDFFPYADRANGFWTGYFTSRPALKRYVRVMSGYYLILTLDLKNKKSACLIVDTLAILQSYVPFFIPPSSSMQCPLLNISYCPAAENTPLGKKLVVVVYNSLGWLRDEVINIPAYLGTKPAKTPKYWLAFRVSVPPFGFSTYTISDAKIAGQFRQSSSIFKTNLKSATEVGQGNLKLSRSAFGGKPTSYTNSRNSVCISLDESVLFLCFSFTFSQNGGAYIFRPNGTYPLEPEKQVPLAVIRGPVVEEIHEQINQWIYQVGPVPIDDGIGKEVVTQITTSMKTNGTFYTDSNGRDFIKRIRDYRTDWNLEVTEPVAGNYYPLNLGIYAKDDKKELSVLVDRALGGGSIKDGQIELLLHRRLLLDDSRGVDEALNETVCVHNKCMGLTIQGKYYYRIDPVGEGAKWRRSFGQQIYSPLLLAFAEEDGDKSTNSHVATFSGFAPSYSLPDNVAVITLQELDDGKVLLRLAHLYEVGEDKDLSVKTTVELMKLFPGKKIGQVVETSLSANQERSEMEKRRLVWKAEGSSSDETARRGRPIDYTKLEVELLPMEIRTFLIDMVADTLKATVL